MNQGSALAAAGTAARSWSRGKDRRNAFPSLLAALSRVVEHERERLAVRRAFEHGIRQLVPVRRLVLRELPPQEGGQPPVVESRNDTVAVRVPTSDASRTISLEASLDPGHRLDQWDQQVLRSAAHLGTLVFEIEALSRARARFAGASAAWRPDGAAPLIGCSAVMRALRERIERVAATDFTVLIEGESGVGKELVARHVHDLSRRAAGPFVAINCAALVETLLEAELFGIEDRTATGVRGRRGKFEHADGGTLFLDEISDLSMSAQAKLLRAIQDLAVERVGACGAKRVDTRIVVATNRSLSQLVERGLFRQDLFYRLSGVDIRVPPLRVRRDDILELATYFLARHRAARRLDFAPAAADALLLYDWPGNVRELERVVEAVVVLANGERIDLDDLPPAVRGDYAEILLPSLARGDTLRAWGSRYARLILERSNQNKRQTCRKLGISYHTLQAYLRYEAGDAADPSPEVPEWPEENACDLSACRVAETVDDELTPKAGSPVCDGSDSHEAGPAIPEHP